jgi:hypothetical protein
MKERATKFTSARCVNETEEKRDEIIVKSAHKEEDGPIADCQHLSRIHNVWVRKFALKTRYDL